MWLLVIVALISTPAFFSMANSKRFHPGKAAAIPFVFLGLLLLFDFFAIRFLEALTVRLVSSGSVASLILMAYRLAVGLAYIAVLAKNWSAMTDTTLK